MDTEIQAVRSAARQLVRELQLLDTRHCIEGFSFSECHLLTELQALGQATASEMAKILVLEKSTMSRLVDGLVSSGYLQAETDPADRRRKLLRLTGKGVRGADRVNRYAQNQVQAALGFVPEAEHGKLADGLDKYARALRYSRLSSTYDIRPIRKADNSAVSRIIRDVMTEFGAVGRGYSINDPEVDDMHGAYPAPHAFFCVITLKGRILGCGGIGPLRGGGDETCELRKMYFLPELRGTGMGFKLLDLCLRRAGEIGYRRCYLETLESMFQARHLYRKCGFEPLDAPLGDTGHTSCNTWMARPLPL